MILIGSEGDHKVIYVKSIRRTFPALEVSLHLLFLKRNFQKMSTVDPLQCSAVSLICDRLPTSEEIPKLALRIDLPNKG